MPLIRVVKGFPKGHTETVELLARKKKLYCISSDPLKPNIVSVLDASQANQYWTFRGLFYKSAFTDNIICMMLDYYSEWAVCTVEIQDSLLYMSDYVDYRKSDDKAYKDFLARVLCP
jgi:hypothetical protein